MLHKTAGLMFARGLPDWRQPSPLDSQELKNRNKLTAEKTKQTNLPNLVFVTIRSIPVFFFSLISHLIGSYTTDTSKSNQRFDWSSRDVILRALEYTRFYAM